jgi:outer membrane protein assembly complex protein YaeT
MPKALSRYLVLHVVAVFAYGAADLAPPDAYEGQTITEIRYQPPTQPVTRADLTRLLTLKPGSPLRASDVRDTVKRLYGTGAYSDVEIQAVPEANGVALVIRTTEQFFVGPVEVRGKVSLPPSQGQLQNASRLDLGAPFEDADVKRATDSMRDLLQRNGLYLSKVDPDVTRDPEHEQVAVTFHVDSGKRARFTMPIVIGDTRIPPEQLAKFTHYKGLFRWRPATDENTQRGVKRIKDKYDKKDRLTASVEINKLDYLSDINRVRVTIDANGGPKIKITTMGAKVSRGDLEKYVPVFDEDTVNRDLLVRGVRNLRDYFQSKGYFDVMVDFSMKDAGSDERDITYVITPGERHKLVRVAIEGNRYFGEREIRERIYLEEAGRIRLRHGRYSEGFVRRDEDAVSALYRDNGFRDVKVSVDSVDDYKGKQGDVAATFTIVEGPQYKISAVDLQGYDLSGRDALVARLSAQPGQPFSDSNVAFDRSSILGIYQDAGFPDATVEYKATPGPGEYEIAVQYTIVPGQPRRVRDVLISGLHTTSRHIIDPNLNIHAGDPLSWTQMGRLQRRLYNLGVFDKVDMAIQNPDGDTEQKYVLYHLTEGHLYYTAIGLGAQIARIGGASDSLDNPGGTTGFAPIADFEISRLNLWGIGHSLNFKSRYSTLERRLSLNYLAPRFQNVDGRSFSVTGLYDNTRDILTFTARRLEGSVQMSQRYSKATTFFLRYTWRDVVVDTNTLKIDPLLIPLASQPDKAGILSFNVIRDRRDDPADAHRGLYTSADLGFASNVFGGNKNFMRFLGRVSYYKRLGPYVVLATNSQLGIIKPWHINEGLTPAAYIPIAEHFFSGGSTSHRGFPDNQAGPRDLLTGFPLGGNALLFHTTELRFPLLGDNINGVLFHDMGNVYLDPSHISFRVHQRDIQDFDYMVHAVGFGIRYRTPVGPLRVDLAYSLNAPAYYGLTGTYEDLIKGTATPALQSPRHFNFFISIGQAF